ncbi:protein-L-isoaspartate(D-aspartate) O-methyltransferase-like isoform X3 [Artemia franciscana]|uniref:protein-L-isoaspartate(D-aspartate) O-methyltransferase-like isoform X3 n=1 Tax=Artemia franciscana TaxID=6661 RepID=UPI0032D9D3BA
MDIMLKQLIVPVSLVVNIALLRVSMAWRSHGQTNDELVDNLKAHNIIQHDEVEKAMKLVDRGLYAPHNQYMDAPQSIGYGATISAPHMHAYALELLHEQLKSGGKVLDVGSGSGYLSACFAMMVGEKGKVIGIEHVPNLVTQSIKNIEKHAPELIASGRVKISVGDGRKGYEPEAPYNAIHVGAAAEQGVPDELIKQLAPGGRMVIPVGNKLGMQALEQIDKLLDGQIVRQSLMDVMYVPLTDKDSQYTKWIDQMIWV